MVTDKLWEVQLTLLNNQRNYPTYIHMHPIIVSSRRNGCISAADAELFVRRMVEDIADPRMQVTASSCVEYTAG